MRRSITLGLLLGVAILLSSSIPALADAEQFQTGHDIHVAADQSTGDVTCLNCSIYIRGKVSGDAFALHGDVVVESGGELAGDVSTLLGDIRVADGAKIGGDVASIAGSVRKQPTGLIGGEVASLSGSAWLLLICLVPLVFLGAIVGLIIWLVQRSHKPVGLPLRTSV